MVMKNYKALFVLLLGIIFTFNAAANYVTNGAFTSNSNGWTSTAESGTSTRTYASGTGRTANGSVSITAAGNTYSYWKQSVAVTAGHKYVLYAFIDGTSVANGAGAGIECINSTATLSSRHCSGDFEWTFADTTFTAQTTSVEVRLCLGSASAQSSGTVYFDDVFLIDKNDNRLLILASAALYNNHATVREAINTYRGDIQEKQNYYSQLIKIGAGGDIQCYTAEDLKTIISYTYTAEAIDGLLFVGSEPDLPVALARYSNSGTFGPSDLFFADVSHNWPVPEVINGVNVYYLYTGDIPNEVFLNGATVEDYNPEMFFGRISAKTVKPGAYENKTEAELIADEAELVVDYFNRIHDYRTSGENLDLISVNRAASFFDDDFDWMVKSYTLGDQENDMDLVQGLIRNMDVFVDRKITSKAKYKSVLGDGYRFIFLGNHGSPTTGGFVRWDNGIPIGEEITIEEMEAEGTQVKANFINLFSCNTGSFGQSDPASQVPLGKARKYYAGYLLFNGGEYMLNVMANTFDGCEIDRPSFYDALRSEAPIGIAFKDLMIDRQNAFIYPLTERILFGDPLIVYNDLSSADIGPKILSDLNPFEAHTGSQFTYTFTVGDPDDQESAVSLALTADPAITGSYNYNQGTRTLTWTPSVYDAGKDFHFKAVATDTTSGNTCGEEFIIPVKSFNNWKMSYDGAGGITNWQKSGTGTITDVGANWQIPPGGFPVPRIVVDDNSMQLSQQVSGIVPNQDYKVSLYALGFLFTYNDTIGGLVSDHLTLEIDEISAGFQLQNSNNEQEFTFSSGNNTSLTFTFTCTENAPDLYLGASFGCIDLTCLSSPPAAQIAILYKNGEQSSSTNIIRPYFQVKNTGTTTVDLADVTIRYWYTKDGAATQNFVCDYAQIGTAKVSGSFVDITPVTGADNYLLVGFAADAGTLAPDANSGDIQLRFNKGDWSNYTQSGDYSWVQNQTTYAENIKTTGYIDGVLNYGTEP